MLVQSQVRGDLVAASPRHRLKQDDAKRVLPAVFRGRSLSSTPMPSVATTSHSDVTGS